MLVCAWDLACLLRGEVISSGAEHTGKGAGPCALSDTQLLPLGLFLTKQAVAQTAGSQAVFLLEPDIEFCQKPLLFSRGDL